MRPQLLDANYDRHLLGILGRQGDCIAVTNSDVSNYPDGNIVEKGAQAYRLRSATTRTMKTCSPAFASCTTLTDFNIANAAITTGLLGAATDAERDTLISWMRGLDVDDENVNGNTTEMRPSVHGDVLHSRPIAINYGPLATPNVVVLYGGNDGVLRAVNGNRADAIGGFAAGDEMWSFVAPEFYGKIKRLRDNLVPIEFEGSPGAAARPRAQASTVSTGRSRLTEDASNRWVFASMRRGGRFLYAFDVGAWSAHPAPPAEVEDRLPEPGRRRRLLERVRDLGPDLVRTAGRQDQWLHGVRLAAPHADVRRRLRRVRGWGSAFLHRAREGPRRVRPRCAIRQPAHELHDRPAGRGQRLRGAGQQHGSRQVRLRGRHRRQHLPHLRRDRQPAVRHRPRRRAGRSRRSPRSAATARRPPARRSAAR